MILYDYNTLIKKQFCLMETFLYVLFICVYKEVSNIIYIIQITFSLIGLRCSTAV